MGLLGCGRRLPELALPALGGFLFPSGPRPTSTRPNWPTIPAGRGARAGLHRRGATSAAAVDYRNLGPEELGSVYESLLELHPQLNTDAGTFQLTAPPATSARPPAATTRRPG